MKSTEPRRSGRSSKAESHDLMKDRDRLLASKIMFGDLHLGYKKTNNVDEHEKLKTGAGSWVTQYQVREKKYYLHFSFLFITQFLML